MSCRILYVVGQLSLGGLEHQLYYLLKKMDRKSYQPELVVWNFNEKDSLVERFRALDIPLRTFPKECTGLRKVFLLRSWVRRMRPELVHSYTFYTNFAIFFAVAGTNSVGVGSVRSDFDWIKKQTGLWLGRLSARWPRVQVFNSFTAANKARASKSPFKPCRALVVRNGLDLESFHYHDLSKSDKPQILGIGSLLPVKRWDRLVSAGASLKARGLEFRIRIAGGGALLNSLRGQATRLGLEDRVELIGPSTDVKSLLAESHFLVHTSDSEGCPNAIMEAMACGRAVIATKVGDISDLVEEGKTGFLVSPSDHATLVERMVRLISDHTLCSEMGQAGRAKAGREFGLNKLLAATLAAYKTAGWRDPGFTGYSQDEGPDGNPQTSKPAVLHQAR